MRLRLLDHLVCPVDRMPLELTAWQRRRVPLSPAAHERARRLGFDPALLAEEVDTGVLVNPRRGIAYPIVNGVPRLLVFSTAIARAFAREFGSHLARKFPEVRLPDMASMPGEYDVLRSFSSEWVNYEWREDAYWDLTSEDMYRSMRYLLDLEAHPVRDKLVLEVGTGIGGIAHALTDRDGCETIGIDLSHAVDAAQRHFGGNPFLHLVQASVFAPPFRPATFDLVFSHGVLHHTYSTQAAFESIAQLPAAGGRLYVWVYSPGGEQRTLNRRLVMALERILRPVCWRLPGPLQTLVLLPVLPLYLIHQNVWMRRRNPNSVRYGWREALHAARDRFTPRFAHRHTDEELMSWFAAAGYGDLRCARRRRDRPAFVPASLAERTAVDGVRYAAHPTAAVSSDVRGRPAGGSGGRLRSAVPSRSAFLLSLLVTLVAGVGFAVAGEGMVRSRERDRTTPPGTMPLMFYQHQRLRHALVRDSDYFGWVHINRLGFRGPETAVCKPEGIVRVMTVGGSTTFDSFVSGDEYAWPARLGFWLRHEQPDLGVEVINAGVPGYVVLDNLIRWQTELYRYRPDVIVLYQAHNDLFSALRLGSDGGGDAEAGSRPGELGVATPWGRWLSRHSLLYTKVVARLQVWQLGRSRGSNTATVATPAAVGTDRSALAVDHGARRFERDLVSFLQLTRLSGARLVIPEVVTVSRTGATETNASAQLMWRGAVPFASPDQVLLGYTRYNDVLRRVAHRFSATFISTNSFGLTGPAWYAEGDPIHFNDRGADRMARQLARALIDSGALSGGAVRDTTAAPIPQDEPPVIAVESERPGPTDGCVSAAVAGAARQ